MENSNAKESEQLYYILVPVTFVLPDKGERDIYDNVEVSVFIHVLALV